MNYECTNCSEPTYVYGLCWKCWTKFFSQSKKNVQVEKDLPEIDYGKEVISEQAEVEKEYHCRNHQKTDESWNAETRKLRSVVILPNPPPFTPHEEIQLCEFWKGL